MTGLISTANDIAEKSDSTPLSSLLEAASEEREYKYQRLRSNLLAVSKDDRQLIFFDASGPTTSRVATTICADSGWLRRYLETKGLAVPATIKVPARAGHVAEQFVHDLGENVSGYWVGEKDNTVEFTSGSFEASWRKLVDLEPEVEPGGMVFEPADKGELFHVTVAFDDVIDSSSDVDEQMEAIAKAAIAYLPGAAVGDVVLSRRPNAETSVVVDSVDVLLDSWNSLPLREKSDQLIYSVLDGEFATN